MIVTLQLLYHMQDMFHEEKLLVEQTPEIYFYFEKPCVCW